MPRFPEEENEIIVFKAKAFLLFLFLCCRICWAETNLALFKPYVMNPQPNYQPCTDELDKVQLTDGKTTGRWRSKGRVGWGKIERVVEITIDLRAIESIGQVRVHGIGGEERGVVFPKFIAVFISTDGKDFEYIALLSDTYFVNSSDRASPHWFNITDLNVKGRFVKLLMQSSGKSLLVDEIEVIKGSGNIGRNEANKGAFTGPNMKSDAVNIIKAQIALKEKIDTSVDTIKKYRQVLGENFTLKMTSQLKDVKKGVMSCGRTEYLTNRLRSYATDVGIIRAKIYNKFYGKSFLCMIANPMDMLLERQMQIFPAGYKEEIDIQLWQAEHESAAVNVVNCIENNLLVSAQISPLSGPGGISVESQKTFTIRRAVNIDGRLVGSVADALVLQGEEDFIIRPGDTTQLWLGVFNPKLKHGEYKATITIKAETANGDVLPLKKLPIKIKIEPVRFNCDVSLNTCVWAFPEVAVETKNSLDETLRDLQLHHTNIVVVHGRDMPFPKKKSIGMKNISKIDYSGIDQTVQRHSYARMYLFYFNWRSGKGDHGTFGEWMSPEWKRRFSSWLTDWVVHLKRTGIGYEKYALYPFDETLCDEFYELAKLIKSIDPKIKIYANSFGRGPREFKRFKDLIDIWCLPNNRSIRYPDWHAEIKAFGKEFWLYSATGPAKANSPYDYYRLMPWYAFKRGQTGAGFWLYVDYYKKQGWGDGEKSIGYYGVVYGAGIQNSVETQGELIVPSRRWEAWREGVEDYQYLYELQKRIDSIKVGNPQKAKKAQDVLDTQVDYVLKNPENCEQVYRARKNITAELFRLNGNSFN